jgi:hypothetical protein
MTILNFHIANIGQSGQVPSLIYLDTNNTAAEVTAAGFLNQFVAQGNVISVSEMAVVVTRATPSSEPETNIYTISYVNGDWVLTEVVGMVFNPDLDYVTTGNWTNEGNWFWDGEDFHVHTTVSLRLHAPTIGLGDDILTTSMTIGNPASSTVIDGTDLEIPNLPTGSTANVVFYDNATGKLTYDSTPGGGADWHLAGNAGLVGGILGTTDVQNYVQVVNGITVFSFIAATASVEIGSLTASRDTDLLGDTLTISGNTTDISSVVGPLNVSANAKLNIGSVTDNIEISTPAGNLLATFQTGASLIATTGDIVLNTAAGDLTFTLQTPASVNNSALVIDTDGTVHVGSNSVMVWNEANSASVSLVASNAYVVNNGFQVVFTLPVTAALGDEFQIQGLSASGWKIAQNNGQNIQVGNISSTVGMAGSVDATNQFDAIKIVCTVPDTTFNAEFLVGRLNVI